MTNRYAKYQRLKFDMPSERVLRVKMDTETKLNLMDTHLHKELGDVWTDIAGDDAVAAVLLTGNDTNFSAGGNLKRHHEAPDFPYQMQLMREGHNIVYGMVNFPKPVVTAIRGWAVGAGLACALLGDISIAAKNAKLRDGHANLGVAAGDHAAIIWPLLCGVARTKYYLMLGESISGEQAERIGLVSVAVEESELDDYSLDVAERLANSSPFAMQAIKSTVNNWLLQARPIFDQSLALEVLGTFGPDYAEGKQAILEKRPANFHRR